MVEEFQGDNALKSALVRNLKTGEVYPYPSTGAFIYIGFESNSNFLKGQVPMDELGHINTNIAMETEIPGVYACGDIRVNSDRQLGNAVGDGITAALSAYKYITEAE